MFEDVWVHFDSHLLNFISFAICCLSNGHGFWTSWKIEVPIPTTLLDLPIVDLDFIIGVAITVSLLVAVVPSITASVVPSIIPSAILSITLGLWLASTKVTWWLELQNSGIIASTCPVAHLIWVWTIWTHTRIHLIHLIHLTSASHQSLEQRMSETQFFGTFLIMASQPTAPHKVGPLIRAY